MSASSATPPLPVVPSHWTLPADAGAARRARRAVAAALPPGCRPQLADGLALLASELVTNAVRYRSRPAADHVVDLILWPADGHYRLAVSDAGAGDLPAPAPPRLDACGGRGLLLVDALSAAWGVVPRPVLGKSVIAGVPLLN